MNRLPLAARVYLIGIWCAGAVWLALALAQMQLSMVPPLLFGLLLYGLADYWSIEFEVKEKSRVAISLVDAPMMFLLVIVGQAGVAAVVLGTLIVGVLRSLSWYNNLFNAAARGIVYLALCLLYVSFSTPGELPFSGLHGLAALLLIGLAFYVLNSLIAGAAIGLATRQPIRLLQRSSQLTGLFHGIGLAIGAFLALLWQIDTSLLVLAFLPLLTIQLTLRSIAGWVGEGRKQQAFADELAARNAALQRKLTARTAELERAYKELDEINAQLRVSNQELEEAKEERERWLEARAKEGAAIAHDLKHHVSDFSSAVARLYTEAEEAGTPLTLIDPKVLQSFRRRIHFAQLTYRQLLTNLRDAAQLEGLGLKQRQEQVDMLQLVGKVVEHFQELSMLEGYTCTLSMRGPKQLPPACCDSDVIRRVLSNLIDNALKYTNEVRSDGRIEVTLSAETGWVICRVSDDGKGIAPEDQARLGERFARLAVGANTPEGLGIGLNFCKRVVHDGGGSLDFFSEGLMKGTTFEVRLPVAA